MVLYGHVIRKGAIPELLSDDTLQETGFTEMLQVWKFYKRGMGFPFSGGWAEQPWWVVEIIDLFESEAEKRKNA